MIKLETKNYSMILLEKLQKYQPYHQAKLISLNILQVKKYCLLIKKKKIEQAKCTYPPLGKAFGKQAKTIEDQGEKQVDALEILKLKDQTKLIEGIFPKNHESDETKNELHKIKRYENKVIRENLFYESSKQVYNFKVFKAVRSFGDSITKLEYTKLIKNKLIYWSIF